MRRAVSGEIIFCIVSLLKTSRSRRPSPNVTLWRYTDPRLCVVETLEQYLHLTAGKRKSQQLLVSCKTFDAITTQILARWVRTVLLDSGVDSEFQAFMFPHYM